MARKNKNNNAVIFIAILVLAIFASQGGFSRNVLADNTCEFPIGGGACVINVTLEEARSASLMKFSASFESVPGNEFIGETQISHFASGGPWVEEDNMQYDDNCREDEETSWMYLYRIPSSFPDYYDLKVYSETSASGKITSAVPDADWSLWVKYVNIPYPYSSLAVCTRDDIDTCSNGEYALVHTYNRDYISSTYGSYNEDKVNIRHDITLADYTREDLGLYSSSHIGVQYTDVPVWFNGTIPKSGLDLIPRSQFAFMVLLEQDIQDDCDWSGSIAKPPTTFISYREAHWPTNVGYSLGDNAVVDTFIGVNKVPVETLDIADQINTYCNRETNIDECVIPLTFHSTTGGKITLIEESTLKVASLPDSDSDSIYDFDDNCVDAANTDQADIDGDGIGDACDTVNDIDADNDLILNENDNCPFIANPSQSDMDSDGFGDACDSLDDTDSDSDNIPDVVDNCVQEPNEGQLDTDDDSKGDACDEDIDGDSVLNYEDNCVFVQNFPQLDEDEDGIGDACDSNPNGNPVVCASVCVPMYEAIQINTQSGWNPDKCVYDACGSGCGPDGFKTFETLAECEEILDIPDAGGNDDDGDTKQGPVEPDTLEPKFPVTTIIIGSIVFILGYLFIVKKPKSKRGKKR